MPIPYVEASPSPDAELISELPEELESEYKVQPEIKNTKAPIVNHLKRFIVFTP
jgi:hypothetical protein